MIKGYRNRFYNDESIHSPRIPLPEAYQAVCDEFGGVFQCLEKLLKDLADAEKEIEQLDILNEFLGSFTKAGNIPEKRKLVYRFVFEWRIRTYDLVISYYFTELLKHLLKIDPEVLKEAISEGVEAVLREYPEKYDSLGAKNDLARKIVGFFDDFAYTSEVLELRWKKILLILTKFMEEVRELSSEIDATLGESFLYNTTSGINSILYRFYERISRDSCKEQLEALLPNLSHYLPNARLNRETRNFCGNSVIVILKKFDKLMPLIVSIEDGTVGCPDDVIMLYLEGMFCNHIRIHEGRENICRILRICATTICSKLYDDSWGESVKTHFVLAIVAEMCRIVREDLSEVCDWDVVEVEDLLTCLNLIFNLCKKATSENYSMRSLKDIMYFCMNQTESAFEGFEEKIFSSTCTPDCSPKWRGRLIIALCAVYSSAEVLQRLPDMVAILREDLKCNKICDLTCYGDACSHQNPSLEALVELCKTTTDPRDQYELFLKHLLYECHVHPHGGWFRKQVRALVKKLVSWSSDIILYAIQDTHKIPLEMIFYAQNCMKKYPESFPKDPILREVLRKGLVTFEEETRVAAAKIFAEISGDLQNVDLFLNLLRFGVVLQHKPYENKINWMGLLTTAVSRRNRDVEEKDVIAEFTVNFRELLFGHLYAGGSFPRQRYALKILNDTWSIFESHSWEMRHLDAIFSCFDSPYEYVKKLTVQCLKKFSKPSLLEWIGTRFGGAGEIQQKLEQMMTSVKPSDSLEAAYQLVLFSTMAPKIFPNNSQEVEERNNVLITLEWCLEIFQRGITDAKASILKASASNPLYGTILCIRYLLDDLPRSNFKGIPQFLIKETPRWKTIYKKILLLCNEASQIVAPIVNNSSPEGFFPDDSELLESMDECVTPQMVLLCGWRTIKEVTLLLGEICEKTPLTTDLITNEEIIQIGENFIEILLESKHRGAFEVSAVGFSKLCTRLRLCESAETNKLPKEWLDELLNAVLCPEERKATAKYVKLCVTRRSAGLPFIIQSILTSYDPLLLDNTMNRLQKESRKNTEGRTHSMNILRYIFRCSSLKTFNYVKDGIKVAIESFGSALWTERNSATLLFSALIVRMFGVCRAKGATEEIPFVNTWIFNEFFEDAPKLYDFMYSELKEGSEQLEKVGSAPQLYPIFLLLERLPTLNGHYGPKWHSGEYVREIERISAKCHDLRIRVLAVKAMITILHPTEYEDRLRWLFRRETSQNLNEFHSRIMQIKEIFRKFAKKDISFVQKNLNNLIELHRLHANDCLVIGKLFMEILVKYLPKVYHDKEKDILSDSSRTYLMDFLVQKQKFLKTGGTILGRTAIQSSWLILKLTLAVNVESVANILIESLSERNSPLMDATYISALNVILLLNGSEKHEIPHEILSEIPDTEIEFVTSLSEQEKWDIERKIASIEEEVFECLAQNDNPLVGSRAFLCMPICEKSLQNCSIDTINRTLTSNHASNDEKICVIRKLLVNASRIEDIFALNVGSLLEFCSDEMNDFTRLNIAQLVAEILKICSRNVKYVREFHLQLLRIIMQLLRDDEPDVRRIICKAIWLFGNTIKPTSPDAFINSSDEVNIPCDAYALFFYMKILMEFIVPANESKSFLLDLIEMEEADASTEIEDSSSDEWKVFDTKEANLFADRGFTTTIVKSFLDL